MDRLAAMQAFAAVVEQGGFTAAAEALRQSRAMVSKHVQDLEAHLGARLLNRTTRRVSLTEAGQVFFERTARLLAELEETEATVGALQATPRGRLRINTALTFGVLHLSPAVAEYMTAYPEVSVELTLNDRFIDLVEEGYDLAIRIARLADSNLIARRLAPCRTVVCAAPEYLKRHGCPRQPQDLASHNCLGYSYAQPRDEWTFDGPGGSVSVRVRGTLESNNGDALRAAGLLGLGIIRTPTFIVGTELRNGALVPLMPEYRIAEIGIHAVYPHSRHLSAKVRSFIDFLLPRYGEYPPWDDWMQAPPGRTG